MDATRGLRVFVDESDRRTEDILSAMDHFSTGATKAGERSNGAGPASSHPVKTHPLLTSPSPTEPLGLPMLSSSSSSAAAAVAAAGSSSSVSQMPLSAKVTPNNPLNHPLHHPPTNSWNSPKHQSKLSTLLGGGGGSSASSALSGGSKVHPANSSTDSNKNAPAAAASTSSRGGLNTPSSSTHEALSDAEYFNAKLGTSFCDEFERLFATAAPWAALRDHAINSRLRNCRFRSLTWKVFLRCLSEDTRKWEEETKACRLRYRDLKRKYSLNPRSADEAEQLDLNLNNPLSQAEDSPWSQYFKDNELKQTIWQDVVRTFPEIEFFQTALVQQLMQDILFVYAREHPSIEYRQGMHELLAPLIFVIHCDQQTCAHACEVETDRVPPLVKTLLEEKSLEPDAYDMFCHMMDFMEPLYQYGDQQRPSPTVKETNNSSSTSNSMTNSTDGQQQSRSTIPTEPFQNKDESESRKLTCTSAINKKLRYIHEHILMSHDHELFTHLERLDIAPQIYGLRWVRLLFGREFPLQDLLILWDAIFADEAGFQLVDFLFVAMLEFLRDFLLASDYTTCMRVLMKFPAVGDAAWFIKKAYNLRDPFSHPRPSNFSYSNLLAKRAKMAKQLSGGGGVSGGGVNSVNSGGSVSSGNVTQKHSSNSSALLTMVAGKQSNRNVTSDVNGAVYHHNQQPFHSTSMSRDHSKSSLSEENPKADGSGSGSVSSAISDGLSRLMTPAGSEIILGTAADSKSNNNDAATALFSSSSSSGVAQRKDSLRRQRATVSEGGGGGVNKTNTSNNTKRSAGIAHRLHARVSTAEEALPKEGAAGAAEVAAPVEMLTSTSSLDSVELTALRAELVVYKNRVNDLESKLGDVGTLVQTACMKLSFLAGEFDSRGGGGGGNGGGCASNGNARASNEATKEFHQVNKLLRECLKYCGQEHALPTTANGAEEKEEDKSAATNTEVVTGGNNVIPISEEIQPGATNCLDDAAQEALQSALMEEAVEATEPTQPLATPPRSAAVSTTTSTAASKGLKAEVDALGPSVSPSSDSSDYSMVDANDEYIVDIVEDLEKKL